MVDHLHPNVEGYILMGNAFYESMERHNFLPKYEKAQIPFNQQDSLTRANFVFTKLDSVIGIDIVTILKNEWPFTIDKSNLPGNTSTKPRDYLDSIALKYTEKKISSTDAYLEAASINLNKDNIQDYMKYMNVLIYKYPGLKDIKTALKYFYKQKKVNPQDYTPKRLGIISIYTKDYDDAINYLNDSYKSTPEDTEILYNLALAYFEKKNYEEAIRFINQALKLDPKNSDCLLLKDRISKL